jgi:hypothetical protein
MLQGIKVQGHNVTTHLKCEVLHLERIYLLYMLQQMLEMPSTVINTCSETSEPPSCGADLLCCILYAFQKLLSDVYSFGASAFYMEPHK